MSVPSWKPQLRSISFLGCALLLAAGLASAQSSSSAISSNAVSVPAGESSSLQLAEASLPANPAALPSAPMPAAGAAQQYGGGWRHDVKSNLAFEVGGGFNAPAGDKDYITWGGQFTVGGGINFNKRFATLIEYQFLDNKLPGSIIAEAGAQGGHVHLWSLTVDPVISLFPKSSNDIYVTGGGGFYRKVTSFTDPTESEYCDYFYGCGYVTENEVVGHFSSNQGGFNIGAGYQHRMGGMYGDSKMKLFAEIRYIDAFSPAVNGVTPNGLGVTTVGAGTKVLPVSVGIRW